MQRRNFIRTTLAASLAAAGLGIGTSAYAADTIKVGILHSLSGTMAISETALKDMALMTIEKSTPRAA
jgi:urea transport system substrate-binding protein